MRDTVVSIILTQVPIAIGCLWVAIEMRAVRRAFERIAAAAERLAEREAPRG